MSTPGPLILIVGSAQDGRADYNPPLVQPETARRAAGQLGAALARKGCRIAVYSSDPAYIERDVVAGFIGAARQNAAGLVQVRSPAGAPGAIFPHPAARAALFEHHPSAAADWEDAFYRSLRDAAGLVIIGGGASALLIGRVALATGRPVLPLATFGAAARRVWEQMLPEDMPTAERNLLARPDWQDGTAAELVDVLLAQLARRDAEQRSRLRRPTLRAIFGLALLLAVLAMLIVAGGADRFTALLYAVGPVAGAGAAVGRTIWAPQEADRPMPATVLLGFLAGLAASLVYLIAQVTAANGVTSGVKQVAVLWVAVTGLGAGFALDRVLKQVAAGDLRLGKK